MNSSSMAYLHLESVAVLVFLAMVVWTQFGRANEPDYDVLGGHAPLSLLPFGFILLAIAFIGILHGTSPMLGFELAAGLTLSMMHPVNALCFMAHLMLLRPWEMAVDDPFLKLLPRLTVAASIISYLIHPKQRAVIDKRNLRGVIYLLCFSGWLLLTTVKVPGRAAAIGKYFDTYFKSVIVFGMAIFFIESERSVREVELTIAISALSLMANGLWQFGAGEMVEGRLVFGKPYNLLGDPNDLGAIIVMATPFVLLPMFSKKTGWFTALCAVSYTTFAGFVVWLTRSRGTMLAAVAQFFLFRFIRTKKNRLSLLITALALGMGYQGLLHLVPRDAEEMAASGGSRLTFWKTAVNMAVHSPIFGVGFGQYPDNYMTYAVGTVYERGMKTAHSSWFLALGESGFIGLFLFIAFFRTVARLAWANRDKRPAQLYALAGYGVAMSFLSHTYSLDFYLLMGLIIASAAVKEKVRHGV